MRRAFLLVPWVSCPAVFGCSHNYTPRRELVIQQATQDTRRPEFQVDMSRVPDDWLRERDMQSYAWGQQITLKFDPAHPVRIIIVPDEQGGLPQSSSQPTPSLGIK